MKESFRCTKCNSSDVLKISGSKWNMHQQIPLKKSGLKNATLNRYICVDCGYLSKSNVHISVLFLVFSACTPRTHHADEHAGAEGLPNIVFILADDMGYGDLGCYNADSRIKTPNIDGLAKAGMRFTDAHAPAAVCVPSRYALLTGRYPFRNDRSYANGVVANDQATIASVLKAAGYRTAVIGKWHLGIVGEKNPAAGQDLQGGPLDHGFDDFFGMPASLDIPPYYYIRNRRPVELPTDSIVAREGTAPAPGKRKIQGPFYRAGRIAPSFKHESVLTQFSAAAVDYIADGDQRDSDPFFLYLPLPAPHTPWLPEAAFRGTSGAGDYGDYTTQVDDVVGSVLAALERLEIEQQTIVIFSSDNGPVWYPEDVARYGHSSTFPLAGMKGDALEGGHRMPFIVKWPGQVSAGVVDDDLFCFTDVLATFAELVNQPVGAYAGEDSQSALSRWKGEPSPNTRKNLVVKSSKGAFAFRKGDWKLILAKGSGGFTDGYDPEWADKNPFEGQLYHLKEDIGERQNLYGTRPDKVEELRRELESITGTTVKF